jgi:tRNA nucleotidyltransferase/poly(A) polymerase
MKIKELIKLIDLVHRKYGTSKPYICGGLPRDKYLGKLISLADVDLTTGDSTIEELSLQSYKVLSKKFSIKRDVKMDGHSSIYFKNTKIDFSSNYIDPGAEFYLKKINKESTPMLLESYSRDFGCNAMLLDLNLKDIEDPTGRGKEDCDNKIIKTLLPPQLTFKANPKTKNNNRIIRSIYLASKLQFTIDGDIVEYVAKNPQLITLCDPKSLAKKLNSAYDFDKDRTIHYLDKMNLWNFIPINGMLSDGVLDLLANRVQNG